MRKGLGRLYSYMDAYFHHFYEETGKPYGTPIWFANLPQRLVTRTGRVLTGPDKRGSKSTLPTMAALSNFSSVPIQLRVSYLKHQGLNPSSEDWVTNSLKLRGKFAYKLPYFILEKELLNFGETAHNSSTKTFDLHVKFGDLMAYWFHSGIMIQYTSLLSLMYTRCIRMFQTSRNTAILWEKFISYFVNIELLQY